MQLPRIVGSSITVRDYTIARALRKRRLTQERPPFPCLTVSLLHSEADSTGQLQMRFLRMFKASLSLDRLVAADAYLQQRGGEVRPQLLPLCTARIRYGLGRRADLRLRLWLSVV